MDPELSAILAMLGVGTPLEARTAITNTNTLLNDLRAATGRQDFGDIRASFQGVYAGVRQLEGATGKVGGEAVNAALAWRNDAQDAAIARTGFLELLSDEQVRSLGENPPMAKLVGSVQAQAKTKRDNDAKAKLDKAVEEGRLRPANRAHLEGVYNKFGMGALDGAIEALPPADGAAPPAGEAPRQPVGGIMFRDASGLTGDEEACAKAMGLTPQAFIENKQRTEKMRANQLA